MKNREIANLGFAGEASPIVFDFLMFGINLISMIGMNATETSCLLTQCHHFIFQSCQIPFHSFVFALIT